jgi:cell division protein FtsB
MLTRLSLLFLCALAFAGASFAGGPKTKLNILRSQVASLQKKNLELSATTRTLKSQIVVLENRNLELSAANDSLRAQVQTLQSEITNISVMLDSVRSNLATTELDRDSWKANATVPRETDRAATEVRGEVTYVKHSLAQEGRSLPDGYLISLAIMNYVVGHVTAPEYGYRNEIAGLPPPTTDVETILQLQAGICGNAAIAFAGISSTFGLPVRSVQFYYARGNHIAVETYYEGGWHYFDPTWGLVYGDGLSITEARSTPNPLPRYDSTLLWRLTAPSVLSDISVLTAPATVVELDKQPL